MEESFKRLASKILASLCLILAGCAKPASISLSPAIQTHPAPTLTPSTSDVAKDDPADNDDPALLWEAVRTEGKEWSTHVYKVITEDVGGDLLPGSDDIETFCPKYRSLSNDDRMAFWGMLVSAIAKYESAFDPTSRMKETTMGTDPITGRAVYSEGLMQLSYQDIQFMPQCEFDWDKDRALSPKDPNKTILNPQRNLRCGLLILAQQVAHRRKIATRDGAYWAVLIPGGKYTKVTQIASLTKRTPGCE